MKLKEVQAKATPYPWRLFAGVLLCTGEKGTEGFVIADFEQYRPLAAGQAKANAALCLHWSIHGPKLLEALESVLAGNGIVTMREWLQAHDATEAAQEVEEI